MWKYRWLRLITIGSSSIRRTILCRVRNRLSNLRMLLYRWVLYQKWFTDGKVLKPEFEQCKITHELSKETLNVLTRILFGEEVDESFLPCDYVRRYEDGKDAELPQHAA